MLLLSCLDKTDMHLILQIVEICLVFQLVFKHLELARFEQIDLVECLLVLLFCEWHFSTSDFILIFGWIDGLNAKAE